MPTKLTIGFLGAGKMATALAKGFIRAGLVSAKQILAADPSKNATAAFAKEIGSKTTAFNPDVLRFAEVLILAVKPDHASSVLAEIREGWREKHLLISIAAGVPIVATAVDGALDILEDGANGFLCAPGDAERMASRVTRLLRDPALRRELAARARSVLPQFDIDAMVRAQERLYRELLERAGVSQSEAGAGCGGAGAPGPAIKDEARAGLVALPAP